MSEIWFMYPYSYIHLRPGIKTPAIIIYWQLQPETSVANIPHWQLCNVNLHCEKDFLYWLFWQLWLKNEQNINFLANMTWKWAKQVAISTISSLYLHREVPKEPLYLTWRETNPKRKNCNFLHPSGVKYGDHIVKGILMTLLASIPLGVSNYNLKMRKKLATSTISSLYLCREVS